MSMPDSGVRVHGGRGRGGRRRSGCTDLIGSPTGVVDGGDDGTKTIRGGRENDYDGQFSHDRALQV